MSGRSPFGGELRHWRHERGLSQLDLSIAADTTSRHVSFLETGRSRPSAVMVERLVEALAVPVSARNDLFEAAGLRGPYPAASPDPLGSEPFRTAIDAMLEQHEPYPAFAFDAGWNMVRANRPAAALFGSDVNVVELIYSHRFRTMVANWPAVAWATLTRLRCDARHLGGRADVAALVAVAEAALVDVPRPREVGDDLVVCPTFVIDGIGIPTVTITGRFGAPRTVAADELQVELIFPSDDAGRRFFRSEAASREDS